MSLPAPSSPPTTPAFRVRLARRGDGEQLGLLLAELGHTGAGDTGTVHWVLSHPEIEVHVAADGSDRPLGVLSFSHRPQLRLSGRIATIDELVVLPGARRQGLGRALVQRALERARVLSVKRVELQLPSVPTEATYRFCEAMGFRDAERGVVTRAP
ncbi:MAG TPA: GNAT family N-acetyltransferase [Myxococcaceae bacterium]|nr:GNAT family N-acetyltransferase [Myxococcaceae bacterium]